MTTRRQLDSFLLLLAAAAFAWRTDAATLTGRVAGEFAASATGAATYTVPIQVAAGMNGLKPAIALAYDSHSGDGLAGMGWTLTGFPAIRRCALTRAVDGRVQGVRFTAQDRFCLDGEPLVLMSGSYGADGAEYRTEVHAYERVFSRGRQGTGPAWFEVRLPDGMVHRYGNDTDSRVEAAGSSEVRAWALNEIEDRFQQRIGFGYEEDGATGEHRPTEIRWSYGAAESPGQARLRLAFGYESRPAEDVRSGYLWAAPWRTSQRLATIDYEADAGTGLVLVHRYSLAYAPPAATQRSRLASITQCGLRDCLPPTVVQWDDGSTEWNPWLSLFQPVDRTVLGDFDGNGTVDLFGEDRGTWAVWPAEPGSGRSGTPVPIPAAFGADSAGLALDYNGDGNADLLARTGPAANWIAYLAPGAAGGTFTARDTGVSGAGNGETVALDVDADGFDDLAYLRNGTVWLRRNLGGSFGPETPAGIGAARPPYVAATGTAGWLVPADFDGDGREDLLVARSRDATGNLVWEAYLSHGAGFEAAPIATLGSTAAADDVLVLDMNGDGLSDVLRRVDGYWTPYISRGTATGTASALVAANCSEPPSAGSGRNTAAVDYDGDGRADLLVPYGRAWRVYRSDGACFSRTQRFADLGAPGNTGIVRVASADRDGDGNAEILLGTSTREWHALQHPRSTRPDGSPAYRADLAREISDGLGNRHEMHYRPLTGWSGYTAAAEPSPAGTRLLAGAPLTVLSQWSGSDGTGGRYTVGSSYAGLRLDTLGRGLLGFRTVRTTDSRTALVTETAYRQDFPFAGRVELATVWNDTSRASVYDPSWSTVATAAPDAARDVHFVQLAGDVSETYEVDPDGGYDGELVRRVARTLTWNANHGAVTREQSVVTAPQEPGVSYRTTRTVTLDESLRSTGGCLGFPSRVDVTRDKSGSGGLTRTVQYGYHASTCRTASETTGPVGNPAQQLRTSYAYDALGRTESITRSDGAGALPPRVTRFGYATGAFRPQAVAHVIAGEPDLATTHSWNDGLGLETVRTVPGNRTRWSHDAFGRLRSEMRSSGRTQISYTVCGPCFAPDARYAVRETRSDGHWTETQHDSLGRVVGRAFVLPDGHASLQVIEYDALGRVARESVPYRDDAPRAYWTSYEYDAIGRVKSVDRPVSATTPAGAQSFFSYAGLESVVRDPETRATQVTHDAEGRMILVAPPLGSNTGYTYTHFGQLSSIVDAGWNGTQFGYDERGLLIRTTHPDAGRRTYAWNAFGELVTQSDGKSPANTMNLEYDQLGRITRRTEPEGVTRWTYVATPGSARGRLQEVTGPTDASATGFAESYAYDEFGRLQRTTTAIDGSSYQTDYGYDAEGQVTTMTYPATVGWRPKFTFGYTLGHLTSVAQEAVTVTRLYTLLDMDALGRETAAQFGAAALEERNVYDAGNTRLAAIQSGMPASPAGLQNYAYAWDRVGNLLARRDLAGSAPLEERFTYDNLNRLTRATLNGATTLTLAYSQDGNIRSKSDVGNYAYSLSGDRPHAVTSVSGGPRGSMSFAYDANGNMTQRNGTSLAWTSYNLPQQLSAGADYARFNYGPGRTRVRQELRSGGVTKLIHHVGPHFEVEMQGTTKRYRSNVFAHGRAIYSQVETTPSGLEGYYVLHDHLGSVDRLVRAVGAGSDLLRLSFDAWGKRRNPDWSADPSDARYGDAHWTERGYTGHEHLDAFRLVNMNSRLEDPLLGRMLTPDPVMGSLVNPQLLNPYSYVANGPTSFADPSGFFLSKLRKVVKRGIRHVGSTGRRVLRRWGRQIAAAVAAYYTAGVVSSWAYAAQTSEIAVSGPAFLSAEGISAASTLTAAANSSAVLGGMAGGAVAGAISSGELKGAVGGALSGGAMAGIGVGYGGHYAAGRVLAEATVGGVSAELRGGNFGDGFLTSGALSSLTWASLEMREAMIRQSTGPNAEGISAGFGGDRFKLGGCRAPCRWSPLGGTQGGPGNFFGIAYAPGSFLDRLVETYAGPHDFLNSPVFYDKFGNAAGRWGSLEVINAANVVVATPFAAASVIPASAYGAMIDE
jgi:RHS repeat-associated protein